MAFLLTYTATDAVDGNVATAEIVVIVYPADALIELNPDNWQIYPNPAVNEINITTDYQGEALLEIYATDGRLLKSEVITNNQVISLAGLTNGLLSIRVLGSNGGTLYKARVLKQ